MGLQFLSYQATTFSTIFIASLFFGNFNYTDVNSLGNVLQFINSLFISLPPWYHFSPCFVLYSSVLCLISTTCTGLEVGLDIPTQGFFISDFVFHFYKFDIYLFILSTSS